MLNSHQDRLDETDLPSNETSSQALNQQINENFEAERNQFKAKITQLENELTQQKLRYKILSDENSKAKEQIVHLKEIITKKDDQIRNLKQEKMSHEQKNEELEKYIETTVKEQMKAYEAQIKLLQESQLIENTESLPVEAKKPEISKVAIKDEANDEDYKKKLDTVASKLYHEWAGWFEFKTKGNKLQIHCISYDSVTDQEVSRLSKDILKILSENNFLNLSALEIGLSECPKLTNKALEHVALTVTNSALHLQSLTLYFGNNRKITDAGVEDIAFDIKKHCKNLKELLLSFLCCNKVTSEKKESLRKKFAYLSKVDIS